MKDESSLMPGGVEGPSGAAFGIGVDCKSRIACGGGGGGGNGEVGLEDGMVEANFFWA